MEGIALAKQRGAYHGRKRMLSDADVSELQSCVATGGMATTCKKQPHDIIFQK